MLYLASFRSLILLMAVGTLWTEFQFNIFNKLLQ